MATDLNLKTLLRSKSGAGSSVAALLAAFQGTVAIADLSGSILAGTAAEGASRVPVLHAGAVLGTVTGPPASAGAVSALLQHLAEKEAERRALAAEVLHLYREIHLIDQLSEQLAALLDIGAVAESALAQARRLIPASSGGILVRNSPSTVVRYMSTFGNLAELPEADSEFAESAMEGGVGEIFNAAELARGLTLAGDGGLRSMISAPLRAKQRTVGLIVLTDQGGHSYSAANLKLLNTIALQTAAAVENSLMCAEMVDNARDREQLAAIQKELDTARTIQHSLVPRRFPPFPDRTDFELHARMTSARAVGGDFFDFFLIDEDRIGIVIGDVSGKGTPAALYMAVTHTHVRSTAVRGVAPGECFAYVNRVLMADKASSMYATCFYGILNTRTGQLDYASAGHTPPYTIAANGRVTMLEGFGGPPLGMLPWKEYESGTVRLQPGDALFVYTDGVPEATNSDLDDFTDERLVTVLERASSLPADKLIDNVHSALFAFAAGAPQSDDITMVAVRLAPTR